MKLKYGLMAVEEGGEQLIIHHFTGYETKPTADDIKQLREELATDSEFGLTGIVDKLLIVEAPKELVKFYKTLTKKTKLNKIAKEVV